MNKLLLPLLLVSLLTQANDLIGQKTELGKQLFFDPILSKNNSQSCATCHNPEHGFIDNRPNKFDGAVSLGDDGKSFGNRNTPTAAYAKFSPDFGFDKNKKIWRGGHFLDGRANNLADQAGQPILNPVEMAMPSKEYVINRLKNHPNYAKKFQKLYGKNIFNNAKTAYYALSDSLSLFEKSPIFSSFDSKYDDYLAGKTDLSNLEELGMAIFFSNSNNNCSKCHQLRAYPESRQETFSNYQYENIGTPNNPNIQQSSDTGLLNNPNIHDKKHRGKFKVPTLRNIAITAPYMHNGVFKNLATVLKFYDKNINKSRIINPETKKPWAKPAAPETVNHKLLKQGKALSDHKINALLAFLKTLTDKKYEHLIQK